VEPRLDLADLERLLRHRDRLVPDAARHVYDDTSVQFDHLIVEDHRALAVDDVVDFVRALVIVELGIGDFQVVDFRGCAVLLLDEWADLSARFSPRLDRCWITAKLGSVRVHAAG